MTPDEYKAWQKVTAQSKNNWVLDKITGLNKGEYLFYKGGESGTYIWIEQNGTATIGYYEDAIPHIMEALFQPKHSKVVAENADKALEVVMEKMGMSFLLSLIAVKF